MIEKKMLIKHSPEEGGLKFHGLTNGRTCATAMKLAVAH